MIAKNINEIHMAAMNFADKAFDAKRRGNNRSFLSNSKKAFKLEQEAALLVAQELGLEPTRSVLHRSAAALALDCGEYRDAERLIATALAGNPPQEIAEELRDLWEQVSFQRHLEVKGKALSSAEIQLSITGRSIGYGYAPIDEVLPRIGTAKTAIGRIIDRKLNKPFDEKRPKNRTDNLYDVYISTPRAASFAVTMQVVEPSQVEAFPVIRNPSEVVDEVLTCFDLFNRSCFEELQKRIPDEAYYNNFVGLARQLEPDGYEVKQVGFTAMLNGSIRTVSLIRKPALYQDVAPIAKAKNEDNENRYSDGDIVIITGELLVADSSAVRSSKIVVRDSITSDKVSFTVKKGMMVDIVRPLYECEVRAEGRVQGKTIYLENISKA